MKRSKLHKRQKGREKKTSWLIGKFGVTQFLTDTCAIFEPWKKDPKTQILNNPFLLEK